MLATGSEVMGSFALQLQPWARRAASALHHLAGCNKNIVFTWPPCLHASTHSQGTRSKGPGQGHV